MGIFLVIGFANTGTEIATAAKSTMLRTKELLAMCVDSFQIERVSQDCGGKEIVDTQADGRVASCGRHLFFLVYEPERLCVT